jgi:hypothetical protein
MRPGEVWSRAYADFLMPSRLGIYQSTLETALEHGYEFVTVDGFWRRIKAGTVDPTRRYLILRHDIDTDPATGRAIWGIDQSLGVTSSYYFRLSTLDVPLMLAIDSKGGEASYHFEELATLAKERRIRRGADALNLIGEAQERFRDNLRRMRSLTGLPMLTVASHGDFTNRRLRIPNWALLVDRGFRELVGIDLEAYDDAFMRHVTSRHSDSGPLGAWSPTSALGALRAHQPVVYLLVHPRQWGSNLVVNFKDDAGRIAQGLGYRLLPSRPTAVEAPRPLVELSDWRKETPSPNGSLLMATPAPRLVVTAPKGYEPERQYILDLVLREWLGLDYVLGESAEPWVEIGLHGAPRGRRVRIPNLLFATSASDWLTERSMPKTPLRRVADLGIPPAPDARGVVVDGQRLADPLPVPCALPGDELPFAVTRGDTVELTVDVLGSAFFLLTRYEEVARPAEDDHGRFPAFASLASVANFLERPVVDDLVEMLWWALHAQWPELVRHRSEFRLHLTHDVDQPWSVEGLSSREAMRSLAGDVLRRRDGELALRRARSIAESHRPEASDDPFDTFDMLMTASERAGLRSTFYVQSGGRHAANGPTYDIADPRIGKLLRRIGARGHTIGLHGSYESYDSAERIRAELSWLVDACREAGIVQDHWGVRQHYLRFATPGSWRAQEAAGLVSDSSLGFADAIGFRASTCREYPAFDLEERRPLKIREQPLTAMDVTLLSYLGWDHETTSARTREIVRRSRSHGGEAVVCFHNSSLPRRRDQAVYRDLVERLVDDLP